MKIKLCGFKEEKSLKAAINAKINFIGFIFHESSPRNVTIEQAKKLTNLVPDNIDKVSVTVDSSIEKLQKIHDSLNPQYFQLHGAESISDIEKIRKTFPKVKIIKAFGISEQKDFSQIKDFEDLADHILIDNKNSGSGKTFDWDLIKNFEFKNDWILSGGLNQENLAEAIKRTNAPIIDISSGIEKIKGEKSIELINKVSTILDDLQ